MPFLGSTPPANYKTLTKQTITGDGSTSYTLDSKVANGNEIEVFVNNVRQEPGTDYSANNNTITFTTALTSSDSCWLVFQSKAESTSTITNDNYGGAINVNTSAADNSVNIDASGNVLVGKTDTSRAIVGVEARQTGFFRATRDDAHSGDFVRNTSNGDIIRCYKENTLVGRIGVEANDNFYIADDAGNCGINFKGFINPVSNIGETRDNAIDLGNSVGRFRNIYLSSGVYVGGTGSANHLDDYEEGTWSPTLEDNYGTSATGDSNTGGHYTKIGNLVFVTGHFFGGGDSNMASLSGTVFIAGIPFAVKTSSTYFTRGGGSVGRVDNTNRASDGQAIYLSVNSGNVSLDLYIDDTTNENRPLSASQIDNDFRIYFSATYVTN